MDNDKTMTKMPAELATALVLNVSGALDKDTRYTMERLAFALEHQGGHCDAIGESGKKCSLRAGHPGDIHEVYEWGTAYRFRMSGDAWRVYAGRAGDSAR